MTHLSVGDVVKFILSVHSAVLQCVKSEGAEGGEDGSHEDQGEEDEEEEEEMESSEKDSDKGCPIMAGFDTEFFVWGGGGNVFF